MRGIEHQRAHGFAECGAAGLARGDHVEAVLQQPLVHGGEHGALAGAFAAFQRDQPAALHSRRNWYLRTARLCASSVGENSWLPSPRATKYSASPGAGWSAASSAGTPGSAIGVGGRPSRM